MEILKKGIVADLEDHTVHSGSPDFLLGYGSNCFKIKGVKLKPPQDFVNYGSFVHPNQTNLSLKGQD